MSALGVHIEVSIVKVRISVASLVRLNFQVGYEKGAD